ncbi:hypothetical protein [Nostoc sp.]
MLDWWEKNLCLSCDRKRGYEFFSNPKTTLNLTFPHPVKSQI